MRTIYWEDQFTAIGTSNGKEQLILAVTEEITLISEHGLSNEMYDTKVIVTDMLPKWYMSWLK